MIRSKFALVALGTAFVATAGSVAVLAQTDDEPTQGQRTMSAEAYATEVARIRASLAPQLDVLAEYADVREAVKLESAELGASFGQADSLELPYQFSDHVVLVRVLSVQFEGSDLGDLPATVKHYEVEVVFSGAAKPGDRMRERVLGGPYRQPDGRLVYAMLPRGEIELPGDRLLLFLDDLGTAGVGNSDISARFSVDSQGRIGVSDNAGRLNLTGMAVVEALASVR